MKQHISTLAGIGQSLQALEGPQPRSQASAADHRAQLLSLAALPAAAVAAVLSECRQLADSGQGSSLGLGQGQGAGPAGGNRPPGGPPAPAPPEFSAAQLDLLRQLLAQIPGPGGPPY